MPDSKQSEARGTAPTLVLRDGFTYKLRNGRVVKLYRRPEGVDAELYWDKGLGDLAPSAETYPWAAHIDGQPRAGGRVLYFNATGQVWQRGSPYPPGMGDIVGPQFPDAPVIEDPTRYVANRLRTLRTAMRTMPVNEQSFNEIAGLIESLGYVLWEEIKKRSDY